MEGYRGKYFTRQLKEATEILLEGNVDSIKLPHLHAEHTQHP